VRISVSARNWGGNCYNSKEVLREISWSAKSVHEFINKAVDKVRTSTLSELKKQLPIADPRHTKHFLEQVKTHYESNDDSLEMQ
jgi:hypothetical protein